MLRQLLNKAGLSVAALVICTFTSVPADAGLLDWLFPGRRVANRQYYVLPTNAYYGNPYYANYVANYGSSFTRPYAWYAPQTQYGTTWAQTPVTSYRPVGANSLQPATSLYWQAWRSPYVTYQPSVAPVAPTAGGCSTCNTGTTAYYGGSVAPSTLAWAPTPTTTTAWSPVAPASNCVTDGQVAPTSYAGSATPWQPVSPGASTTAPASNPSGATPWTPVTEGDSSLNAQPTPADQQPSLKPIDPIPPQLESDGSGTTQANFNYQPPTSNHRLVPWQKPIPDPDGSRSWDFDDPLRLRTPIPKSARATERWAAIPVQVRNRPAIQQPAIQQPAIQQPAVQRPAAPATPSRFEGPWRSAPR